MFTTILSFFESINTALIIPSTIIFFGAGIILTFKTRFLQLRAFPRFLALIKHGYEEKEYHDHPGTKTINQFHALFAAMGTSLGMGNIVGPGIAIYLGGPGALFWLLIYMFFASVTKFTEVTFALYTRIKTSEGVLIGGPMEYLKLVSPLLASWYVVIMSFLLIYWSGLQANTLGQIFLEESLPPWMAGVCLAAIVFMTLKGGAQRVGNIASRLVPLMCFLYISFALFILLRDFHALTVTFQLIAGSIFSSSAALGGFAGATVLKAMQAGAFQAIFISEAGLGTSSIPHAMAQVKRPTDQGILALYSMIADAFLSLLSGLLVLVTGVWTTGAFRSTLVYEVFKMNSPVFGRFILLGAISLFVVTTVIGNCFNGMQTFASIARQKWVKLYVYVAVAYIVVGPMIPVRLIWEAMNTMLFLVAVPNLLALLILAFKRPDVLRD